PPPSRLTFRVTERTYRTTWGGGRPSSQRGIVVDGEPARGAAPHHGADGDPPVADPAPTGATGCTGDPRRRAEQRRPRPRRESASGPGTPRRPPQPPP